ncbi:uncharacterized protein [Solanum lycopersicum]|uniref:uncharacterized protein n=1 Tax=Solanum lycopersicum TaxID=4081 RepID=UPI00374945F9
METAISDRQLVEGRQITSSRNSGKNREESSREVKSPHQDLSSIQKSTQSTVPIDQEIEANFDEIATESPELRPQFRPPSSQFRKNLSTGIDGQITGGENSGDPAPDIVGTNGVTMEKKDNHGQSMGVVTQPSQKGREMDKNSTNSSQADHKRDDQHQSFENAGEHSSCSRRGTQQDPTQDTSAMEAKSKNKEINTEQGEKLVDQQGNTMEATSTQSTNSTNKNSNFPLVDTDTSPQLTPNLRADNSSRKYNKGDNGKMDGNIDEHGQDQNKENKQHTNQQEQQLEESNKKLTGTKSIHSQKNNGKQMEQETHTNKQKEGIGGKQMDKRTYHNNFPKISNNFSRYDHTPQTDRTISQDGQVNQTNVRQLPNQQQAQQSKNNNISEQNAEPAPYTVVQSFAARLRYNEARSETPISLNEPIHTTKQGFPAVLIDENDYYVKLAEICKYTLIGKFTNTMPRMEQVRKSFILQTQLMGGVKITHFNSRHVYIDLDNELDYQTVWTKLKMTIEGQAMRIQVWTPDFTPEEETPIVPIWVSIPGLPWHCYNKVFLSTILESIGKVLFLDSPTSQRTRGSTTRVKIQVDLTKERPAHVWLGFKNSNPNKGRWLKVEYEGIPSYCFYCRHQGHKNEDCTIKRRDEEIKRKKDLEVDRNNKEMGAGNIQEQEYNAKEDTEKNGTKSTKNQKESTVQESELNQTKPHKNSQQHHTEMHDQATQGQQGEKNEEQWQTQKKKHQKQQDQNSSKPVWRPVTQTIQGFNDSKQQEQANAGISKIPIQNNFSQLDMQENQDNQQARKQDSREGTNISSAEQNVKDTHNNGKTTKLQNRESNSKKNSVQETQMEQQGEQIGSKDEADQANQSDKNQLNVQPNKNNPSKRNRSIQHTADTNKNKRTGIDLSLPNPQSPNNCNVDDGLTDEVAGGMDGGCQEIAINLQEGDSKGGNLPHVLHEGLVDPRTAHRAIRNVDKNQAQRDQTQQQAQNNDIKKQAAKETTKEQVENLVDKDHVEQNVTMVKESSRKSKNKPSKQKRDAEKKRQNRQLDKDMEQDHEVREESCNKFVMVDDNHGLNIPPLQVHYMAPHTSDSPYKMQQQCRFNTEQGLDEYGVINSEDELGEDNQSRQDSDDNDETSEALIRAFSPYTDQTMENEVQQLTKNQSLSPRSFQKDRFHFTKQDAKTVTAGRPNTRLFSSRSSQ